MEEIEQRTLEGVLGKLGLPLGNLGSNWSYTGAEPKLDSSVALALAARTAVMAEAVAVAEFWTECGGPQQSISVDRHDSLFALCSGLFQTCHGHDMAIAHGARAALTGFYETRDGRWFHPMGTYPQLRDGALDLFGCSNSHDAIAKAVRKWDALELEDAFAEANLAGVMVRSRAEWTVHRQGMALANEPIVKIKKISDTPQMSLPAIQERPLAGIKVLDFTHVIAGPTVGRTLAEQGADCLRVSSPTHPDPVQFHMDTDWGKRSCYLDLQRDGDLARLRELSRTADVFVQSWRPGAMGKWGLVPEELAANHPGLIYVSVDAWGEVGPWRFRKGFEQLAQAATGVALEEGDGSIPRYVPTGLLADYLAGYFGAAGAIAALLRRQCEGGSYEVRVSLARVTMWAQGLVAPPRSAGCPSFSETLPSMIEQSGSFGRLRHPAPFAHFSISKPDWMLSPSPSGRHPASWLGQ